jgi:ABC-2 type transport system ATP-binding protein
MAHGNYIIKAENLTKKFGSFTAVDNISLSIRKGEIFGFLGPNGAGKTTTISMLTTLIGPTSGSVTIAGHDLQKEGPQIRSIIGVVPQSFSLFPELTAEENLVYIGRLYGMSPEYIRERSSYLLKQVTLYEHKSRIAGVFSGGMKQRLSLAASLMSSPKILFMDEPTTGLDPQSRIAMRELTKEFNRQGMTIVYTTHDMEEAEKICDRIVIMDKGKIVADGTSEELKHRLMTGYLLEVKMESPPKDAIDELRKLPNISKVSVSGNVISIVISKKDGVFYQISDFFHRKKLQIEEIEYKEPTLEEVFIHLTRKDLRE